MEKVPPHEGGRYWRILPSVTWGQRRGLKLAQKSYHVLFELPLKALFTRDILTHNIEIKRYCNKNIFEPLVSIGQGKLLTKHEVP